MDAAVVRQAEMADVDAILDLLTEFELPRAYFEPWYLGDPGYRPSDSWLIEREGRLAAHLRVFERSILMGGAPVRVGGIGNVVTARGYRGQGYAGRLLTAVLEDLPGAGFAYSLLGTELTGFYARYGWVSIAQQSVHATIARADTWQGLISVFEATDLPEIIRLHATTNAGRSGPTLRTPDYWRGQLAWLREDRDGFLVARTSDAALVGYVRSSAPGPPTEVLELGVSPDRLDVGQALLDRLAERRGRALRARLPGSLLDALRPDERVVTAQHGLMGRVLNAQSLAEMLRPSLESRLRASGQAGARVRLETSGGVFELHLGDDSMPLAPLTETQLSHLLFHGFDGDAEELLGSRADRELLHALFPIQDFVTWPADDF